MPKRIFLFFGWISALRYYLPSDVRYGETGGMCSSGCFCGDPSKKSAGPTVKDVGVGKTFKASARCGREGLERTRRFPKCVGRLQWSSGRLRMASDARILMTCPSGSSQLAPLPPFHSNTSTTGGTSETV